MRDFYTILPRRLEGTSLHGLIEGMHRIYGRIENAQAHWMRAAPYRCPEGCGTCCETFEPDLLEGEAYYLAAFLVNSHRGGLTWDSTRTGCVLADPSNPYHCTVYEGRPLVCRLFAFSGDRGKDGTLRYRPCKYMPEGGTGTKGDAELLERYGALPPAMGDLAIETDLLAPGSGGERRPLRELLPEALAKVHFLCDLAAFRGSHDSRPVIDDGDNDGPPIPAVS